MGQRWQGAPGRIAIWVTIGTAAGALVTLIRFGDDGASLRSEVGVYTALGAAAGLVVGLIHALFGKGKTTRFPAENLALEAAARSLDTRSVPYALEWLKQVRVSVGGVESDGLVESRMHQLLRTAGFRLSVSGRIGSGAEVAAIGLSRCVLEKDGRVPVFVRASGFRGDVRAWLESEINLRYQLDRSIAADVVHIAFPIVDLVAAGDRRQRELVEGLLEWDPGFLLITQNQVNHPLVTEASVLDLDELDAAQLVAERFGCDLETAQKGVRDAGLGAPRTLLEVVTMADWLSQGGGRSAGAGPPLLQMWVDRMIDAAGLPAESAQYLGHIASWMTVNRQSAIRSTDVLPSSSTISRLAPRVLVLVALVGGLTGLAAGGRGGALTGALLGVALAGHSIFPHSHGRPGEVDTRRGWASVVKNSADVALSNLLFGLAIGLLAGSVWSLVSIVKAIGPWAPLSIFWIASQVWKPFVYPIALGFLPAVVFFVDGITAFAFWNAFQKVLNARAGRTPLRLKAFLGQASKAGLLERDGPNFRFPNRLLERYFEGAHSAATRPEVVHPGFWYHPKVRAEAEELEL